MPVISIVIPTLGRISFLLDAVEALCKQNVRAWECLVITQSDLDNSALRALAQKTHGRLRVFRLNEPNASLARNVGLLTARGEIVLFLDDDIEICSEDFLQAHLDHYRSERVAGVAGQILGPDRTAVSMRHRWSAKFRNGWLYFPMCFDTQCSIRSGGSGNLSVRRSLAIEVGGMDANYIKGAHREESDFCLRYVAQFGPLVFDPKASIVHLMAPSGGCRVDGMNQGIHPIHHVAGEWYFILKGLQIGTVTFWDLRHHLLCLVRRQIFSPSNRRSVRKVLKATSVSFQGLRRAYLQLRRGPRYIDMDGVGSLYQPVEIPPVQHGA